MKADRLCTCFGISCFDRFQLKCIGLLDEGRDTNLALDEHVEEVVTGFLVISVAHQVAQVVVGDPQTREAPDVDALVVQAAALGAGDQVEQLLCLRGGGDGGI